MIQTEWVLGKEASSSFPHKECGNTGLYVRDVKGWEFGDACDNLIKYHVCKVSSERPKLQREHLRTAELNSSCNDFDLQRQMHAVAQVQKQAAVQKAVMFSAVQRKAYRGGTTPGSRNGFLCSLYWNPFDFGSGCPKSMLSCFLCSLLSVEPGGHKLVFLTVLLNWIVHSSCAQYWRSSFSPKCPADLAELLNQSLQE